MTLPKVSPRAELRADDEQIVSIILVARSVDRFVAGCIYENYERYFSPTALYPIP